MANIYIYPYLRKGISCNINSSGTSNQRRADIKVKLGLELNDTTTDNSNIQEIDGQTIQLMGPADIKSISTRAINMVSPPENTEVKLFKEYMPFIEFFEEDLPWRYTPVQTDDKDFHPWFALIAVKEDEVEFKVTNDGSRLAVLNITSEERYQEIFPSKDLLPKLAHVQIDSKLPVTPDNINILLDENPDCGISRILCTSQLEADSSYVAILIPAYKSGRMAVLGQNTNDVLLGQCAWEPTLSAQSKIKDGLTFPCYKKWKFQTSKVNADFKTLAGRLFFTDKEEYKQLKASLDVDISQSGLKDIHYNEEEIIDVPAVLKLDCEDGIIRKENAEYTKALKELLELNPVLRENETNEINMDEDPWIVPPIYGARHLLTTQSDFHNDETDVVKEVNLELKNRIAAGLGNAIVKKNQEEFINRAWRKVEKINQLNQAIREYCQMQEVDNKASKKHEPVVTTDVDRKDKALLLDVTQRSLQAAKIYRNQVSADRLLTVSKKMPKAKNHNQKVNCGITVDSLKNIYSVSLWEDILNKKELRNQLANKLEFYETFPDYNLFEIIGFEVNKSEDSKFHFFNNGSLHTVSTNSIFDKNFSFLYLVHFLYNDDSNVCNSKTITYLSDYASSKKSLFDSRTSLNGKVDAIPTQLYVGDDVGIIVPDMEQFKKISAYKPIRLEYYEKEKKNVKRYYYVVPLDYVKKKCTVSYDLSISLLNYINSTESRIGIVVNNNGEFVPKDSNALEDIFKLTRTEKYNIIKTLADALRKLNTIVVSDTDKTDNSNGNVNAYRDKSSSQICIKHNNFTFKFNPHEKRFSNVINKNGNTKFLDCKKMSSALETIKNQIAFLERIVWEPNIVRLSNINYNDFITISAESIIDNVSFEPILDKDVNPILNSISEANKLIEDTLKTDLNPDDSLSSSNIDTIDPNKIGIERIKEITEKYGYTEDNQITENLNSKYPVMAYPDFLDPTFFYLRELSTDYIIPSSGSLKKNSITYFKTNAKFEESFLMGMNNEMGQELLWREYPTDQRGSYFRKFWDQESLPSKDKIDEYYDVKQLDKWNNVLGKNHMKGKDGMLVFAIRGELMQFYPNTRVYLSVKNGNKLELSKAPDMTSWLSEEIVLIGFENLDSNKLKGYYLTFEQEAMSLQFERGKGQNTIHEEFAFATPHIYAIPLENRNK